MPRLHNSWLPPGPKKFAEGKGVEWSWALTKRGYGDVRLESSGLRVVEALNPNLHEPKGLLSYGYSFLAP